jgi:hypothetical protein
VEEYIAGIGNRVRTITERPAESGSKTCHTVIGDRHGKSECITTVIEQGRSGCRDACYTIVHSDQQVLMMCSQYLFGHPVIFCNAYRHYKFTRPVRHTGDEAIVINGHSGISTHGGASMIRRNVTDCCGVWWGRNGFVIAGISARQRTAQFIR